MVLVCLSVLGLRKGGAMLFSLPILFWFLYFFSFFFGTETALVEGDRGATGPLC